MDRIKPSATFAMTPEQIERLRDEFAMAALTALGHTFSSGGWSNPNEYQVNAMAKGAYSIADAMLKARQENPNG